MAKQKQPTVAQKYDKAMRILGDKGFTYEEALELQLLIRGAWTGGIGLSGTEIDEIMLRYMESDDHG